MRVLITGGTGFLGSHLVRMALKQGAHIRLLVREGWKRDLLGEAAESVECVIGDVRDSAAVHRAMHGIDAVYHSAAYVGIGHPADRSLLHEVNVRGTAHVVDAALHAGVERMVATSSIAALGRPEQLNRCIDESAVWTHSRFNTGYARSKYEAELEVARGIAEGLDAVLVNPSLIFGPGRSGENTWQIAESIRDGKLPAIPPGSTSVVDVEDVAAGHLLAMERGETGSRYVLTSENLSWSSIIETLAEAIGVSPPRFRPSPRLLLTLAAFVEFGSRAIGQRPLLTRETARMSSSRVCFDSTRAREQLGWTPRPFALTARRMAEALA